MKPHIWFKAGAWWIRFPSGEMATGLNFDKNWKPWKWLRQVSEVYQDLNWA